MTTILFNIIAIRKSTGIMHEGRVSLSERKVKVDGYQVAVSQDNKTATTMSSVPNNGKGLYIHPHIKYWFIFIAFNVL